MLTNRHMTIEAFVELVENNPDSHFDFTADGEVIEVSPKRIHSQIQTLFARFLDVYMENSPLPEQYEVLTVCGHKINGWPCRPVIPAFAEKQILEVYQADADDQILSAADVLDGGDVMPDFQMVVRGFLSRF